jgi:hypothetical protein
MPFVLVIEWFWQSRRRVPAWIAAILTIAVLGYSTFLQFQVNGEDFFLVYRARAPLEDLMTDELRPYFYERHAGLIVADLVRCQGHPDDLPFFPALKQLAPDASMTRYRRYLSTLMEQTNLYWWPPKQPAPTRDANSGQPEP